MDTSNWDRHAGKSRRRGPRRLRNYLRPRWQSDDPPATGKCTSSLLGAAEPGGGGINSGGAGGNGSKVVGSIAKNMTSSYVLTTSVGCSGTNGTGTGYGHPGRANPKAAGDSRATPANDLPEPTALKPQEPVLTSSRRFTSGTPATTSTPRALQTSQPPGMPLSAAFRVVDATTAVQRLGHRPRKTPHQMVPFSWRNPGPHQVAQHPKTGPYVVGPT